MTLAPEKTAEPAADWPDFDAYPVHHRLTAARSEGRAVAVTWDDGLECRYHVFWLRENAPDPATTHPVTREQALQLIDIPEDLTAEAARVDADGCLEVTWSSGEVSRYHPGWLRAYSHGDETFARLPERRLWVPGMQPEVPRFDGPQVLAEESAFDRWAEALYVTGAAILENLPARPETIEDVPARLGPLRETNFGKVFDVRSRVETTSGAANSNAYTAMALPLHTDLCTREYKPGLQFLHCLENGAEGGDSLLADGFALAAEIAREDPEAYETLTRLPVAYYNKATESDYRHEAPMFGLGRAGKLEEVRWSPWLRAPVKAPFEDVDRLYRGLRRAFALAEEPRVQVRIRLQPGELLGFDNRRVLHGRTGFDPATGSRWLRGCYVEREELESRLRLLQRRRRQREMEV